MSRIRTVKPEWSVNERLNRCGDAARVLSIVLITLADDHGNGRASVGYLTGQAWCTELEDDAAGAIAKCKEALSKLAAVGFVRLYDADGQRYFHINGWSEHQKIAKVGKERVPLPPVEETPTIPGVSEPQKIPEKNNISSGEIPLDQDHYQDQDHDRDPRERNKKSSVTTFEIVETAYSDFRRRRVPKSGQWRAGRRAYDQCANLAEWVDERARAEKASRESVIEELLAVFARDSFAVEKGFPFGRLANDPGLLLSQAAATAAPKPGEGPIRAIPDARETERRLRAQEERIRREGVAPIGDEVAKILEAMR